MKEDKRLFAAITDKSIDPKKIKFTLTTSPVTIGDLQAYIHERGRADSELKDFLRWLERRDSNV